MKGNRFMLNRILIPVGLIIVLGSLIAAKPSSIDNTVNLLESASEPYNSDEPIDSGALQPLFYTGGNSIVQFKVPSNSEAGIRYNHTMPSGIYRIEIWSPEGLPDLAYSPNYVWNNWPDKPPTWHRWHGGAVFILKNKFPVWVNRRVSNWDAGFPGFFFDYPYNQNRKRAADAARGAFVDIALTPGDFLIFLVNELKGDYGNNYGNITLRLYPKVDKVIIIPESAIVPITRIQDFKAKAISFGLDGVEGTADDRDVTVGVASLIEWEVSPTIGSISVSTGSTTIFTGEDIGNGTITATLARTSRAPKSASANISVVPDIDKVIVEPDEATVVVGHQQEFIAKGIWFGDDGIEGTEDDIGPFALNVEWSIGEVNIGSVFPESGSATTFTAVSDLPENRDKLTGQVVATYIHADGEKVIGKARVTIRGFARLSYIEAVDLKDPTRRSQETLQMVSVNLLESRSAVITAFKDIPELKWALNEPEWAGLVSATGVESVTFTDTQGGMERAKAGNVTKFVNIEIIDGKINEVTIGEGAFKLLKDILEKVAQGLKGRKDVIIPDISGSWKWYKVDQTRSPLVQTTYEFSAGGSFRYSDKFYIPSLSISFPFVKVGVFAEPDVSFDVTGIEIVRDGTKNPVEFTQVSGGAALRGSISEGAGAEVDEKKVLKVKGVVDLKGSVGASGDLEVSMPGPKLSGDYNIGELSLSGTVEVFYKDGKILSKKVTKIVWESIKDQPISVDFSGFFTKE